MKVNLLVIATNRYTCFLEGLLDSADEFFLKDVDVVYSVFTDRIDEAKDILSTKPYFDKIEFFLVEHRPFPYTTLRRFHFFSQHKDSLDNRGDYHFYVDADCLFKKGVKAEDVISARTCVQHCGYVDERGTYETNPRSQSYVGNHEGSMYYGGGFWGFSNDEFWKFVETAVAMIDIDENNGLIPVWHDESVLNKYLIIWPPQKVLTPSFHYPENHQHIQNKWKARNKSYECVILLLNKNHEELRK